MRYVQLLLIVGLVCCGGSSGEPLVSGSVAGTYEATAFTVKDGVLGVLTNSNGTGTVIALSSDDFDCDTLKAPSPPSGDYAAISVPTLAVGTYNNVNVTMFQNNGQLLFYSSSSGTLDITAVADASVSATITYSDTANGQSYELNGTFEVKRCK